MLKKLVSTLLIITLVVVSLVGCGSKTGGGPEGSYKIAVAFPMYNSNNTMFKNFLENYIAEEFNIEFIFSETLANDVAKELQFMENAKNSGAQGYITFNVTNVESLSSVVARANDLGLYIAVNGALGEEVADMPYYCGSISSQTQAAIDIVSDQFTELTNTLVGDGEKHNVVLCTMGASQGSEQHILSSVAALNALKSIYGLTYDKDVYEIATSGSVTDVDTGTDIKLKIVPGIEVTIDVEQALKGGEYDTILCVGPQYAWFESVISEVEKSMNMDIRTGSIVALDEGTMTSFSTPDVKGNPSLNCAIVKNSTVAAQLFALIYNALTGNADIYKVDGKATEYSNLMWFCKDPEIYEKLFQIDGSADKLSYTTDEIKSAIKIYNPDVSVETFEEWCLSATSENILAKRGIE